MILILILLAVGTSGLLQEKRSQLLLELERQLRANGALFPSVEALEYPMMGVGLRVRDKVEAMEIVATVPLSECVRGTALHADDAVASCASALLDRYRKDPRHPWFRLLFEHTDLGTQPMTWEDDDFERRLRGLSCKAILTKRRRHLTSPLMKQAYALVASRAYWLSEDEVALIPFVDFANHKNSEGAYVERGDGVFSALTDVALIAAKPLDPGTQLFSTYLTEPSNAETFASFGFVHDPSSDALVILTLDIDYSLSKASSFSNDDDNDAPFQEHHRRRTVALRIRLLRQQDESSTVLEISDDDKSEDDLDLIAPRLPLADFLTDLTAGGGKHPEEALSFFNSLLAEIPSDDDDDDPPEIASMLSVLRREERLALEAVRDLAII